MVQEAPTLSKQHLQTGTKIYFILVRCAKTPPSFFTNKFSSNYGSNVSAPEGTFKTNSVTMLHYLSKRCSTYELSGHFSSKVMMMVNGKGPRNKRKKCVSLSHSGAFVTRPLSLL